MEALKHSNFSRHVLKLSPEVSSFFLILSSRSAFFLLASSSLFCFACLILLSFSILFLQNIMGDESCVGSLQTTTIHNKKTVDTYFYQNFHKVNLQSHFIFPLLLLVENLLLLSSLKIKSKKVATRVSRAAELQ